MGRKRKFSAVHLEALKTVLDLAERAMGLLVSVGMGTAKERAEWRVSIETVRYMLKKEQV